MHSKLILVFLFCFLKKLNAQTSICSYENNIDYAASITSTYLYTSSAQLCCSLCGYRSECIGNKFV